MSELKRVLGLPTLTFYGTGMILGAGIYSVIGKAAGIAGVSLWLSFAIAAICAALTALSYAELSSMIPKAGAEYIFLSHTFPSQRWIATSTGLMMTFSAAATAATVALAFSGYFSHFADISPFLVSALLILIFSALNIYGIKESSRLNVAFTLIEICGLIFIIFLGMQSSNFGHAIKQPISTGTMQASSLIIFAYLGFENLVNFTEEAKTPQKNIPRAVLLSLTISTILYMLVGFAALALLPIPQLASSNAPLMDIARVQSNMAGNILGIIALFSTANTVLIALLAGSRILYGIAKGRDLPHFIARVHETRKTPWISGVAVTILALLLLNVRSVELAANLASFSTMLSFALVNVALVTLRFTQPDAERPFRVPFTIGKVPVLTVIGILTIFVLLVEFEWTIYALTFAFIIAVSIMRYFGKRLNLDFS